MGGHAQVPVPDGNADRAESRPARLGQSWRRICSYCGRASLPCKPVGSKYRLSLHTDEEHPVKAGISCGQSSIANVVINGHALIVGVAGKLAGRFGHENGLVISSGAHRQSVCLLAIASVVITTTMWESVRPVATSDDGLVRSVVTRQCTIELLPARGDRCPSSPVCQKVVRSPGLSKPIRKRPNAGPRPASTSSDFRKMSSSRRQSIERFLRLVEFREECHLLLSSQVSLVPEIIAILALTGCNRGVLGSYFWLAAIGQIRRPARCPLMG